jgi:beta-N-acetylhexosaminidase
MNEQEARQTLGQIFALRFPRSWDSLDLNRFPVANYIIFRDALEPTFEASRDRIRDARTMLRARGIEPVFMMDEEGGRVTQISGFFPSAPSPRAVAKVLSPDQAADLYAELGAYLGQLGIDVNLAPCLDVNTESLNPIIGTRAFASDTATVTRFGERAIGALRRSISCVAKHFPGHGMTKLDSHLTLPFVDDPRETLQAVHMAPFKDAVRWCADGIMVSHCLYRALEVEPLPASLSTQIVRDHLRINLGYDGLVFTDSLDMKPVTQSLSPRDAAVRAFEATCDILLYTDISERFESAFETLVDMLLMGKINKDHLTRSVGRRRRIFERSNVIQEFKPLFDRSEYCSLADAVRDSCVRVDDARGLLPLAPSDAVVLSTSSQAAERIRRTVPTVKEIGDRHGDLPGPAGKTLIVWLAEPLTVRHSLEALRSMIRTAGRSVLVTSYDAVATSLAECDVKIVTDDLSPQTEDSIVKRLFGAPA